VEQLQKADWRPSRQTDADEQCEFFYQPVGWNKACRFVALRYDKAAREAQKTKKKTAKPNTDDAKARDQYKLFDTAPMNIACS